MKRGTTYTQIVTVPVDLTAASDVVLTVKALGQSPISYHAEDLSIAADARGTTIAYKLSEEQSLALREGYYDIDVNWMLDGSRGGTRIERVSVSRTLYNQIIGGGDDTPDPTATEPDPINLTSEEVRVLNAISPKITNVQHVGSATVVTIKDVAGEHEVEIPDGAQGADGYTPVKGVDYFDGADGKDGKDGVDGYTPVKGVDYFDGADGKDGKDGSDGYTPVKGVDYFDGQDGADGADGYSPAASVTKSGKVATITITDKNGTTTQTVSDGEDGDDYVLTAADKAEIAAEAAEEVTVPVQDVQVNGVSVLDAQGVANVPVMGEYNQVGLVKIGTDSGLMPSSSADGTIMVNPASDSQIKAGNKQYFAVTTTKQHAAAFYGFAKAAGNTDQASSNNPVGQYTEDAKSAISEMLNGSVPVTGTTPTIAAKSGIQYVCGEVSTLDITLPASGIVDVVFTSGSTPTVLTITPQTGMTVEWANGFDSTALEADTLYELNIKMVGTKCLGVAGSWS